jgi:hypothetical protein
MIIIGEALVSEDILEKHFICALDKCKGACCVSGDRGAPLVESEIDLIESIIEKVRPFMDSDGIELLNKDGFYETDPDDGELITTCRADGACVFVVFEDGITQCAIEKAHQAGVVEYKKPMSCHLYPIRAAKYGEYTVLNYDVWDICKPACAFGLDSDVKLYQFLKEPLIRKMGVEWYNELVETANNWEKGISEAEV